MKKELVEPGPLLLEMTRETDPTTVWTLLRDWLAELGFDRLLYAATRFRTDHSMGDIKDAFILTNYPKAFTDEYLDGGLFRNAPMVRWAMENTGCLSWSEIAKDAQSGHLPPEVMRVVLFNHEHGVVAGYGISFPRVSARTGHGIGLGATRMSQSEVDALWQRDGEMIEMVCNVAHLTLLSLPYGLHGRRLTDRQREVLEMVADGKTIQDVAVLMERNPATVEKHLRLARDALDVETTAQAILKLGNQNQFFRYRG